MERILITNEYNEADIWELFEANEIDAELDGYDRFIVTQDDAYRTCDILNENGYDAEII